MAKKCLSLIIVVFLLLALFPATGLAFSTVQLEGWERLNAYRSIAGVNTVALDEEWCRWCQLHSHYCYPNNTLTHIEDPSKPGYTDEGAIAGYGCLAYASTHLEAVDDLISTVYHRISLLDHRVTKIGFGFENGYTTIMEPTDNSFTPDSAHQWAIYPGPCQTGVPISFEPWYETPNPLPGVNQPVGYPITLQHMSYAEKPIVTLLDSSNQSVDFYLLTPEGQVAIVPKQPLKENEVYYVTITGMIVIDSYLTNFVKSWWFATRRSTPPRNSFSELAGIPSTALANTCYFPWYDCSSMDTWVLVGNPNPTSVNVKVLLAGIEKTNTTIAGGSRQYFYYSDLMDGPAKVETTGGNVFCTQRVHLKKGAWSSFSELAGIPSTALTNAYYFPWYDCQSMDTWI